MSLKQDLSKLISDLEADMKCPHCGATAEDSPDKCPKCGKAMSAALLATELQAAQAELAAAKQAQTELAAAKQLQAEQQAQLEAKDRELKEALAQLEQLKAAAAKPDDDPDDKDKSKSDDDADDVKAKLLAAETALTAEQEKLAQTTTALEAAHAKLAEIKAKEREAQIKPLLSEAAWTERAAKFQAMDDDMFATVVASLKDAAKKPAPAIGLRSGMPEPVAGSGTKADNGKHAQLITLR